jgi:methionine-S-sulfoxide reductase
MRVLKLIILLSLVAGAFVTVTTGYSAPRSSTNKDNRATNTPSSLPPGDFARDPGKGFEVATLAGGCFWGMEEIIRKLPGVKDTQVGYTGGRTSNPSYKEVSSGKTGHAEAIQVIFDPTLISFEQLLGFYFRMHDPTTLNQQGNDKGTQYRSVIFYYGPKQAKTAKSVRTKVDSIGKWKKPIVTEIVAAQPFWRAEAEHQDYLQKNPNGYTCHYLRDE